MAEGEGSHSLGHHDPIPAEGDHPCVQTPPLPTLSMVSMLGTDSTRAGACCPRQTNVAIQKVSEGEEVGQTILVMVDIGIGIQKSLQCLRSTEIIVS